MKRIEFVDFLWYNATRKRLSEPAFGGYFFSGFHIFCKAVDEPLSKVPNVSRGHCAHLVLEQAVHFYFS